MKHFTLLLIACTACWGAGPTPIAPTRAEIIFNVPPTYTSDSCTATYPYIGDVTFGGDFGYVALMQFVPPYRNSDCGSNPNPMPVTPVPVHRIPLGAGEPDEFTVGTTQGTMTTRVVGTQAGVAWVHSPTSVSHMELRGEQIPPRDLGFPGGAFFPAGLVADDMDVFVVATAGASNNVVDVNSPSYPCCSMGGSNPTPSSLGWKVSREDLPAEPLSLPAELYVVSDTLKTGMVANDSTLFFAMREIAMTNLDTDLLSMAKNAPTTAPMLRGSISIDIGVPVGLAANDDWLGWTVSTSYANVSDPNPRCGLFLLDLADPAATQVRHFSTFDFSCQDLAFDDTHAYFTIVDVVTDDRNTGNPGNMRGIGIGRVSLSPPAVFESIATGIDSVFSGARRIYIHNGDLYVVDPFAIVRIAKSALDGEADF